MIPLSKILSRVVLLVRIKSDEVIDLPTIFFVFSDTEIGLAIV